MRPCDFGGSEPAIAGGREPSAPAQRRHGRPNRPDLTPTSRELLAELRPDVVAIEQLYAHYKHPRTAILMGHARGVILLACRQAGVGVRSLAATHVKKSLTGNGHASKLQIQRAIQSVCQLKNCPSRPTWPTRWPSPCAQGRNISLR